MERKIKKRVTGRKATDGAGVKLVRVLGNETAEEFDPILMLDSFDSTEPKDYIAGFPQHPHRGIETISYLYRGKMLHRDSLGSEDMIVDGEVQWMNSGSGILHEEQIPEAERLLGVQLWLNLPGAEKMSRPYYHSIRKEDIPEIRFEGGTLRLLAGEYQGQKGFSGEHLPVNYYDIHLQKGASLILETGIEDSVMAFTLLGTAEIAGESVAEKIAVKLTTGDTLRIAAEDGDAEVLVVGSRALKEPIAWYGPIVMNTTEELKTAFLDLQRGSFLRDEIEYTA